MATMIHTTPQELREQKERLLREVSMTEEELRERAATYSLRPDELDIWHTIEGIDYLLEGDC